METPQHATRYRWDDLQKDYPMNLLERRRVIGARAMISEVLMKNGCRVPTHKHENEQFACVIRGRVRFGIGADGSPERQEMVLGAGEVLYLPSNTPHSAIALEESLLLDIFSPPSEKTGVDRVRPSAD